MTQSSGPRPLGRGDGASPPSGGRRSTKERRTNIPMTNPTYMPTSTYALDRRRSITFPLGLAGDANAVLPTPGDGKPPPTRNETKGLLADAARPDRSEERRGGR